MPTEEHSFEDWLTENRSRFLSLSESVVAILSSLLQEAQIPFLSVTNRTKDIKSATEKVKRKGYKEPASQMTDISGIRVIFFFEHDIEPASKIVESAFNVDKSNSTNRDDLLSVNEVGYRSVHFVCDLGAHRCKLPEFQRMKSLKFEIQLRTVLQHAWAELAHDSNYKFAEKLPKHLERKLYLLAGMLESVDGGFSLLSAQIDEYTKQVAISTSKGHLDIDINSLSLKKFISDWSANKNVNITFTTDHANLNELIRELSQFGIKTLRDLSSIIPDDYAKKLTKENITIFGLIRSWMMISDPDKFISKVKGKWYLTESSRANLASFLSPNEVTKLYDARGFKS